MKFFNQNFGKRQLISVAAISVLVAVIFIVLAGVEYFSPSYAEGHVMVSGDDGGGRRGLFVIWLLLIVVSILINVAISIVKLFKRTKPS